MTRPLLSFDARGPMTRDYGREREMPIPPWQTDHQLGGGLNSFPVPSRHSDGILNLPPPDHNDRSAMNRQSTRGLLDNDSMHNSGYSHFPVPPRHAGGILQTPPAHSDRPLNRQNPQGLLDSPPNARPPWLSQDLRQDLRQDHRQDHRQEHRQEPPPSLLSSRIQAPERYKQNTAQYFQEPKRVSQSDTSPMARNRKSASAANNKQSVNRPVNKPKLGDKELEQKAQETGVSVEYFDKVKSVPRLHIGDIALEFARKEFYTKKGLDLPRSDKPSGVGHQTCNICKINFLNREKFNIHINTDSHQELEDLYALKKEQARLILENKMTNPKDRPDSEMIAVVRAEVEMNLKPKSMQLDDYILGVYESIMKPYWPVPKSDFYCRICNYMEFKTEIEQERHKSCRDHQKREDNYEEAFCLFCQTHNTDSKKMAEHEKTPRHIKIMNLMEKSKQCSIEHWHKVNNLELPAKYHRKPEQAAVGESPKVGSKRSAPEPEKAIASPTKKVSASKPDVSRKYDSSEKRANGSVTSEKKPESSDKKFNETKRDTRKASDSDNRKVLSKADSSDKAQSKTTDKKDAVNKSSMWFAPISGFMCIACHKFLATEGEQTPHMKEAIHLANVVKLKRMLNS